MTEIRPRLATVAVSVGLLLVLWQLLSMSIDSRALPSPTLVFAVLLNGLQTGELPYHVGITLARVAASFLLAMIIGKVSGMRFAEFLDENIFQPVGMTRTVAFAEGVSTVPNRAYGYAITDSGFVFRDQSLTSAVLGDGGIYSSVEDLFKWDQILYTDRLVSRATFDEAKITAVLTDDKGIRYGFGWRHDEYRGHARMHHTGTTCGFSTVIQRYPEDQFSIIILTNRNKPRLWEMADRIADLYLSDASQEDASD